MPPKQSRRARPQTPHLVVKIGGSLFASHSLSRWLAALRQFPHRLTIVPGGGPFADAVRRAQETMGFSDEAAHVMALLAMEQFAAALADLDPELVCVSTFDEAAAAHERGAIALWRPLAMTREAKNIPASWEMTSDSLSAWYAGAAAAPTLLLVKSVDLSEGTDVVASGIVDPLFPTYAEGLRLFIAGPSDLDSAAAAFRSGGVPGARIILDSSRRRQKIAS